MAPRTLSLTPDLVALCERAVPEAKAGSPPIRPGDLEALTGRLQAELAGEPLWVFAYGSLLWQPDFEFLEQRRGRLYGWHRSFCLELRSWRGTPEQPGLMLALQRGGCCDGVAFRLPPGNAAAQIRRLLEREMAEPTDLAMVRWVTVATGEGSCRCLAFWVGPEGPGVARRLPLPQVARVLASACGHVGSCAAYLYNTVAKLEEHGIRDRNLWQLQALAAAEIRRLHAERLAAAGAPSGRD